ncbi:MAG TPA: PSD1 and planctomycete cytochrome C domain-containing protein, partial [Gemmata sp.]|nr:PSD1 and planctomycete cytochrome C domain-containing protein [Gemmata sp.]
MLRTAFTIALLAPSFAAAAEPDAKAIEFFENKIRPVLVEQCLKCHSMEAEKERKLRGGLRLDTKAGGWDKGGDTGPAIVPGKPGEGTLIKSLKYADPDLQMPPKGKLSDAVIKDFEKWIADGAIDPRGDMTIKPVSGIDIEKGRQFWSFIPPKEPAVPTITTPQLPIHNPIDAFVHQKWTEKGVNPVPAADKRTLIRRVYLDLIGLPPPVEEIEAFLADNSPDALAKVVDKLLANSGYGEKWARHWLDVARYAEDQAHTFGVKPKTQAWRYRDWVIAALNADMPYDRFVKLQIAGDMLADAGDDPFTKFAGLGFLGLGAEYYKNTAAAQAIAEELDDRVDTLTRGFLGLTVACARCHDHKFDPIPTRDYYSIAGIYMGTNMSDAPLATSTELKTYNEAQAKVKEIDDKVKALIAEAGKAAQKQAQTQIAKYLIATTKAKTGKNGKPSVNELAKAEGLNSYFFNKWVKFLDTPAAKALPALKDWFALKPMATDEEMKTAAEVLQKAVAEGAKNQAIHKACVTDQAAPLFIAPADAEKFVTEDDKPKLTELRAELEKRKKASPPAPAVAHVISGNGAGMKVYIRGNPATLGDSAPKGFLQVIATSAPASKDFTRLDLANAIASKDNPLTARVIVNRVWAIHFGRGLVSTPSNFGKLGDPPSHPELLDWLAVNFMKNGWSLKWLHRQIVSSSIYQLDSRPDVANDKIDAGNIYLWRGSRRRLDIELWRDSLLAVSGNLDPSRGGPTYDLRDPNAKRRTVYARISRHELDGLLRLFDFPDANVTADKRTTTTVPQQQLFTLNSEFMTIQARSFAARIEKLASTDPDRVIAAYRLAFGRTPDTREMELAERFLKLPPRSDDKLSRWQQYAQILL